MKTEWVSELVKMKRISKILGAIAWDIINVIVITLSIIITERWRKVLSKSSPQYNVKTELPKIAISVIWELTKVIYIKK